MLASMFFVLRTGDAGPGRGVEIPLDGGERLLICPGPGSFGRRGRSERDSPGEGIAMARRVSFCLMVGAALAVLLSGAIPARADETCMSPYMPKITGQEDYVYVWTLGIEGVGDGSDKLVTIGANP